MVGSNHKDVKNKHCSLFILHVIGFPEDLITFCKQCLCSHFSFSVLLYCLDVNIFTRAFIHCFFLSRFLLRKELWDLVQDFMAGLLL